MNESIPATAHRQAAVQRVLYITLALNLLVFVAKVILGATTGSLSLIADALHSVSDSASNILGLAAMRMAKPEPDWDHPYGHSKFESVGALGIAAFLAIAFIEIVQAAFQRLVNGDAADLLNIDATTFQIMVGVLIINIFVTLYERWQGTVHNSRLLLADARHTLSDVGITIVVLLGLLGVKSGWFWLDTVLAFPVGALVLWSSWEVLRENIPVLTDRVAISPNAIHEQVMTVDGVLNCHEISSRGIVGQQVFVEMHLVVKPLDVESAHNISEQVEQVLRDKYGQVHATIHLEPHDYIEPFDPQSIEH
ncbi:MAG: cation diffusion facilitator family transporter [Cyanobacteria bacterium P01_A01_bin.3]